MVSDKMMTAAVTAYVKVDKKCRPAAMRAALEAALSAAELVSSRNDEAGYVEFLNQDVPYIVRDIHGAVAILMDLETRNVVGYRVYDPNGVYAKRMLTPASSVSVSDVLSIISKEAASVGHLNGSLATIRDAVSALSAQVQDVAGWQLVPVEPTAGMIAAAKSTTSAALTRSHATEIYRAILAAAPAKQEG